MKWGAPWPRRQPGGPVSHGPLWSGAVGPDGLDSWEQRLLQRAAAGLEPQPWDPGFLKAALCRCEQITAARSRTFHLASGLLPPQKRQAIRVLYAFCRRVDDAVDASADPEQALAELQARLAGADAGPPDPVLVVWGLVQRQYRIPAVYVEQLLEGVSRDLQTSRYESFEALAEYCYGVASTVGLMAMHIIGYSGPEAVPYAVRLGVALQLTNILRDVAEDWGRGRLYLPLDELAAFGLGEEDVAAGRADNRWRDFMRFQVARARAIYRAALPGIGYLHPDGRLAVAAAAELYGGILDAIEANNYDVFGRRAHLSLLAKVTRLPAIWWRVKWGVYWRAGTRRNAGG